MVMTYSRAKVQGQRSVGSEDIVERNRRTEAIALPPTVMWLVINERLTQSLTTHILTLTANPLQDMVVTHTQKVNVRGHSIQMTVERDRRTEPIALPSWLMQLANIALQS